MKLIEFIRLLKKHFIILIVIPVLLALLVSTLTSKPDFTFSSQTTLYTGLATGSSIEMDKTFNYFVTNTAFDNLINIINSRETQEEVAIRLLSQHLLLDKPVGTFISAKSMEELHKITPAYIYGYVIRNSKTEQTGKSIHPLTQQDSSAGKKTVEKNLFPTQIDRQDYEATVQSLTGLMKSSDTNFVYKLLNYENPHYSIKAISNIKAIRIGSSDLIKLSYEVNDPGICQQTLAIFNEVCIKNYKNIKENRSDEVVKYFENQLSDANNKLKIAEDQLLDFNKSNNIINYYEQSKAVAVVKEDIEVDYSNKKAQLAGLEASIKRLEEKLNLQQLVQLKSGHILDIKKQLGDVNYEIAAAEAEPNGNEAGKQNLTTLKKKAETLKNEIRKGIDDLYTYQNTVTGLPVSKILNEWITNVIEAENLRAKLIVMEQRKKDFQQQYSVYAPAGANIKRIEREISVSEQGYLELLHGLNQAKLKLQDNELSSNIKAVDSPYFPLNPIPTKRKLLVIASALIGFIFVLGIILLMEYFDRTLRNLNNTVRTIGIPGLTMLPRVFLKPPTTQFPFMLNRMFEMSTQKIIQTLHLQNTDKKSRIIVFISTLENEGKTFVSGNIAKKLKELGMTVKLMNYASENEMPKAQNNNNLLSRLLGYPDNRIDFNSSFLANPSSYLTPNEYSAFPVSDNFYRQAKFTELNANEVITHEPIPDYILIELPALLCKSYSSELLEQADLTILVARSNRIWSEADRAILNDLQPLVTDRMQIILNGVELKELESVVGELPKKHSAFRNKIKSILSFQFFSKNQF